MKEITIEKSLFDEKFREECVRVIDSAKREIYIIAGELSSLKFDDMRNAVERASIRGVDIHMYATNHAPETFINYAVSRGYELFIGEKGLETHYLLADGKNMVISKYKEVGKITIVGERRGVAHYDNEENGREVLEKFNQLAQDKNTIKINKFEKTKDPFYQLVFS